jgi:ketosteroid isomerase-like protein
MRSFAAPLIILLAAACATSREARILREIRAGYDKLESATARRDPEAMIAMRTSDFFTIGPDGKRNDAAEMAEYSRRWFKLNKPPIEVHFTIKSIEVRSDDEAAVIVFQHATRYQELAGKLRKNEHNVTQRETWRRTPAGWRIAMVDQVGIPNRWIDGKRVDPSKPYDPDAPEYVPPPKR